jgi:nucleoside-diphosphate-sugar epimerase
MSICLVTGGTGFIGSHIVETLLAQGHHVRVLDNLSTGHLENLEPVWDRLEFIEADIRHAAALEKAAAGVDFVFHLAAVVSVPQSMAQPVETELVNAVGTLNVLRAARAAGARRLVMSSTCAIYGDEPTLPKTEAMPPQPKSPYAISKLAGEWYCRLFNDSLGLQTVVLRYFNVFGPRQDPSSAYSGVISIFADRVSRGLSPTIFGDGQQTRDFVFVDDVARANVLAATTPAAAGQVLNIGAGRQVTINQLFRQLSHIFDYQADPIYAPMRAGDILHSYSDPTQARLVLGWSAQVGLEDGLRRLLNSLKLQHN